MPSTVVTGAAYEYGAGGIPDDRNNFRGTDGWHYVFYWHANGLHYKSSQDGETWSAEHDVVAVSGNYSSSYFGIFADGDTVVVFYLVGNDSTVNNSAQFNRIKGTAALGTITWNAAVKICDFGGYFRGVSCCKGDTLYAMVFNGYFCAPWAPAGFASAVYTSPDLEVWTLSLYDTDASDTAYYNFPSICKQPGVAGGFIFAASKRTETSVRYRLFDGANWAASVEIANMKTAVNAATIEIEYDIANSIAHLFCKNQVVGGNGTYIYVFFDGVVWSAPVTPVALCRYPSACLQTTYGLYIFYSKDDMKIYYRKMNPVTKVWDDEVLWQATETPGISYLKCAKNGVGSWTEGQIGVNYRIADYKTIRYETLDLLPPVVEEQQVWAAVRHLPPKKLISTVRAYVETKHDDHLELIS